MAFNIDPSISLGVKPPQGMSLGDMLNIARGAQEFKKAQAINPLEIRKQEAETTKAEETLRPAIEKAQAESQEAQTRLNSLQLENTRNHFSNIAQNIADLMIKSDLTPQDIIDRATEINQNAGGNDKSLKQLLLGLPANGTTTQLKQWLAQAQLKSLNGLSQVEKMYPSATTISSGGQINLVSTGNPLLTGTPAGTQLGPSIQQTVAPGERNQIIGTDAAGNPIYASKGATGNIQGVGVPTPIAPPNAPAGATMPVIVPAGQTGETYKGQATSGYNLYQNAIDTMTNPNSKSGYLPAKKQVTDNIITLLKDPTVDTGPITNYFAGKTGQETLTPKEQELAKYLEQRIQNQNPSSQMDLQSKHTAYGSINLKKDALIDLIRNEKATQVTSQDLLNRGVIRVAGNQQNPNINAINGFKDQFAMYANDPTLMKLISLTGEKQKVHIDKDDKNEINKLLHGMTAQQKQDLLKRRENVLRLVNGE